MVVFYEKYDLADGATGPIVLRIPYEQIIDVLSKDIKAFIVPEVPAPSKLSFEVKHDYSSWYFGDIQLVASCEPTGNEPIEGYWIWGYYNNGEILIYPAGTTIAIAREGCPILFEIRSYDNNTPLSDWVYETTLTEEMANRYFLIRCHSYNIDSELLIKVESADATGSTFPVIDNEQGFIDEGKNSDETGLAVPDSNDNEMTDSDKNGNIDEIGLPATDANVKAIPDNNGLENNMEVVDAKQGSPVKNDEDFFGRDTIIFITGVVAGIVILTIGFILHKIFRKQAKQSHY